MPSQNKILPIYFLLTLASLQYKNLSSGFSSQGCLLHSKMALCFQMLFPEKMERQGMKVFSLKMCLSTPLLLPPRPGIIYILLTISMTYVHSQLQGRQENSTFAFSLYNRRDKEKTCELFLSQSLPEVSFLKVDQYFLQSSLVWLLFPSHNLIQEFRTHLI